MESLLGHCAETFAGRGGLFVTFFIGGLTGGFTHCLAMCGPFAACESFCASGGCGAARRSGFASLPYHLGRLLVYGLLGFFAALLASRVSAYRWWPTLATVMLAGAGVLFLLSCLHSCLRHGASPASRSLSFLRGALLGFLPCGLLYAALMMAATLANPLQGMLAMWLFTLGTMPALLIAGMGTQLLNHRWRESMRLAGRAAMAINGISLLFLAAQMRG